MDRIEGQGRWAATSWVATAFAETANPAMYVPRELTEGILGQLVWKLSHGSQPLAIWSAPGLGKTLLLHLLADRIRLRLQSVYLPYGALDPDDLCAWALGRLREPAPEHPRSAILDYARALRAGGRDLVLLIDDADSLPLDTARHLGVLLQEAAGAIRLVVALSDDADSRRVVAALAPQVAIVRLHSMTLDETRHYVTSKLEIAAVPLDLRERFDVDSVARIHHLSGGVPRRVHHAARAILEGSPTGALPPGMGPAREEDAWLGQPLDELSELASEHDRDKDDV